MTPNNCLRIGTRGSLLARTQTDAVARTLRQRHADLTIDITIIRTTGDNVIDKALSAIGGKGLFTKELEEALLDGRIDLAVHSLKDLPTEFPDGLHVAAVPEREDPRDALIGTTPDQLSGLKVGTSSLRRAAQLRYLYPNVKVVDLRGNVDTRLRKVKEGVVGAAVMALAGLRRVGRDDEVGAVFEIDTMLPAPAQGALGLETRQGDERVQEILNVIHCRTTHECVTAERAMLEHLGGGCQVPIAAHATIDGDTLHLAGRVISVDGKTMVQDQHRGPRAQAESIGKELAETLVRKGAGRIIEQVTRELEQGTRDG